MTSCRTIAVLGADAERTRALEAALTASLPLTVADSSAADALVLLHGLERDAAIAVFTDLTPLAGRQTRPRLLVGVAADDVDGAGSEGVVKTAAVEWNSAWKCIAIRANDATRNAEAARTFAARVVDELARGGADREVRLGDTRAVRVRIPEQRGGAARSVSPGPWIISGGARGVTAACAVALAREGARQVVLLGRTPLADEPACCRDAGDEPAIKRALIAHAGGVPDLKTIGRQTAAILAQRDVRRTIASLETAGTTVRYAAVDVADANAVEQLVADVRRQWGPIRGVVHAAGVLADRRIGDKTNEQFVSVMRTKVTGARALLAACDADPLETICFFSSVAAHAGNAGQADYAAANAALDRLAAEEQARRGSSCRVVSIAWGPWDGGMVTAGLARHFASRGITLIPLDAGAQAFVDELRSGTHAEVMLGCGLDGSPADGRAVAGSDTELVRFTLDTMPMLRDHRIESAEVLPMTVALDTLVAAGRRVLGPRCEPRNLRVLQGLVFDAPHADMTVSVDVVGADRVAAFLVHPSGRPAYRVELIAQVAAIAPMPQPLPIAGDIPEVCRSPYAGALFHGPAFQVIEQVRECTSTRIAARLRTARGMEWSGQWQLDPAALDGALQLLRLWGVAQDGEVTLPTEIARCRSWAPWPATALVGCIVSCRRDDRYRISGDALFVDVDGGQPLLSLDGIVMHVQSRNVGAGAASGGAREAGGA